MPWTDKTLYRVDMWCIDGDATRLSTTGVWLSSSYSQAAIEAFLQAYADALYAAMNAGIVKVTVRAQSYFTPHTKAQNNSDINQNAVFLFASETPGSRIALPIAAVPDGIFLNTGPYAGIHIDQSQSVVANLIDFTENGDGTCKICSADRHIPGSFSTGYRQYRNEAPERYTRRVG